MTDTHPPRVSAGIGDLLARLQHLVEGRDRVVVGLAGPPGVGKSTIAARLVAALPEGTGVVLPMDGFHLAGSELERLGLAGSKGSPHTFDSWGYAAALTRIRDRSEPVVLVPRFDRDLEEPIAAGVAVPADVPLVLTEGNYLLLEEDPWPRARGTMTQVWYLDVADELRRERLLARHVRHGRSPEEARAWVETVDEPNARLIAATARRADLVVRLIDEPQPATSHHGRSDPSAGQGVDGPW